jgi:hypothetical protein
MSDTTQSNGKASMLVDYYLVSAGRTGDGLFGGGLHGDVYRFP